ncbi:MAG: T9SS type A sorting domain-containing protein [Chitinophagales bacterium]
MKYLFTLFLRTNILFIFFFSNVVDINAQEDTIPPVVTLIDSSIIVIPCYGNYIEFGANAIDNIDGTLGVKIGGDCVCTVNAGSYIVTYSATDNSENSSTEYRLVIVQGNCEEYCDPNCSEPDISPIPLITQNDSAYTQVNTPVTVYVLNNDNGINMKIIEILDGANFGIATIVEERHINYIPNDNFVGIDSFQYKVKSIQDWTVGSLTFIDTALVIIEVGTTSIEANPTYPSLQIFPNPAKNLLTIEVGTDLAAKRNVELLIFNTVGQLQVIYPVSNVGTSKVNIEGLQKGLYLFQLKAKGEVLANGKVLVE